MANSVKPVPDGYRTVTPSLVVHNAARAIEFYRRAFGALESIRMEGPYGLIAHAELRLGDSMIMLSDELPGGGLSPQSLGGTCVGIFLYVDDVDAVFERAVSAGARVDVPLANMFWGDRFGRLTDPFGHSWGIASHIEDVAPEELGRRVREAMRNTEPPEGR